MRGLSKGLGGGQTLQWTYVVGFYEPAWLERNIFDMNQAPPPRPPRAAVARRRTGCAESDWVGGWVGGFRLGVGRRLPSATGAAGGGGKGLVSDVRGV